MRFKVCFSREIKANRTVLWIALMHSHSFRKVLDLSYSGFVKLALRLLVKFKRMVRLFIVYLDVTVVYNLP